MLIEMRSYVFLLLALLHSLGCAAIPLYDSELQSMADRGLGAALAEVNSVYAVSRLYRVTRGSVTRVIPVGLNTMDLLMIFGIKETDCAKTSRNDPQTCAFRPGFFVPSFSCSARVRMTSTSAQVVSLRCGHDSSSSSESSEEVFSRRRSVQCPSCKQSEYMTVLAVPTPSAPPVQFDSFRHSQTEDAQPRGDSFSNYLV